MPKFVALLRGINVTGNKRVSMVKLKEVMEKAGAKNVKTLLASGNVIFEGKKIPAKALSEILEKSFGFPIDTIVIPWGKVEEIVLSEPFKKTKITPQIRTYVTFLSAKPQQKVKTPYQSEDRSFTIIKVTDLAAFSVLDLSKTKTPEAMLCLEKIFGKKITTRNMNTVYKIAKA